MGSIASIVNFSIEHITIPSIISKHCDNSGFVYISFPYFERTLLNHINDGGIILNNVVLELKPSVLMKEYVHSTCLMWFEPIAVQDGIIVYLCRIKFLKQ